MLPSPARYEGIRSLVIAVVSGLRLEQTSLGESRAFVDRHHRHHPALQRGLFPLLAGGLLGQVDPLQLSRPSQSPNVWGISGRIISISSWLTKTGYSSTTSNERSTIAAAIHESRGSAT